MEPSEGYHCLFQKTEQRAGAVGKFVINWDVPQKITQGVDKMYSSRLSRKEKNPTGSKKWNQKNVRNLLKIFQGYLHESEKIQQ